MNPVPKKTQMIGRIVQLAVTKGGIALPETPGSKESKILLVDLVGPDVKQYKQGDFVVPRKYEIVMLRGGVNWFVLDESDIVLGVEGIDLAQVTIDGKAVDSALAIKPAETSAAAA